MTSSRIFDCLTSGLSGRSFILSVGCTYPLFTFSLCSFNIFITAKIKLDFTPISGLTVKTSPTRSLA